MSLRKRWLVVFTIALITSFSILPLLYLQAQDSETILTLAVPEYMGSNIKEESLKKFEESHSGVKINLVKTGSDGYFPPAFDTDKFFESQEKYAKSADVLYVSSYGFSPEGTRAGYFLDLNPLIKGDSALNVDDFIPVAWQSFAWDNGQWALPVKMDLMIISYDPEAFDKAGLAYPNENWTLDDLIDAGIKLTVRDAKGEVTDPGLVIYNIAPLFRSLLGEAFYDASSTPNNPKFDNAQLATLLEKWAKFNEDTKMTGPFNNYQAIPLRLDQSFSLASNMSEGKPRRGALLPGGKAGVTAEGFAVSSGTQHPELAYEFAKFLVTEPTIYNSFFGYKTALKNPEIPSGDAPMFAPKFSPENQALLDKALENAIPASEYRFWDYISKAINEISEKKTDAKTALQSAEAQAVKVLQTAEEKHSKVVVTVATPVPTPVLSANEVSLKFNLTAYIMPLPNKDMWDKVIKEFITTDPQVRYIALDTNMGMSNKEQGEKFDCFALPYNAVLNGGDTSDLLNIDPLMSADPEFDKNDIIGNTLVQFQKDSKTYALPLYLQPQVLRYNTEAFEKANVPLPTGSWTIDEFTDALKALKPNDTDPAPFAPLQYGGNYLLMLIASYGGMPIDLRTDPPIISYTDQANTDAIRQVLDLAKQGYIKYQKLAGNFGGGGGGNMTIPIYTDSISMMNFYAQRPSEGKKDPYKYIQYPKGTQYTPVAFDIGAGYISAKSTQPEACYRWLRTLSKHPELFSAMPAFRSALESDGAKSQGADAVAFFKTVDAETQNPSAVIMSGQPTSTTGYITQYVLFRAFDRYVLDGKDLETELKDAETFGKSYIECASAIPAFTGSTQQEQIDYYKQFTDCAIKIDPSLKPVLSPNS
jgi:ABC-type glycerol-3-phosphate transport system substrate-binding protein